VLEIVVRRATPEDAASLAAVEVLSWQAAYRGLMPDAFLDGLSQAQLTAVWHHNLLKHGPYGRKRVLVAAKDASVIGFVRVGPLSDHGEVGLVYLLYVLPAHWGRGVGKLLMRAALDELHDLGMREAILWVLRDNRRARAFYESLGWCQDGRAASDTYGGVELEALCYRRALRE
jgi:GNAT superfamily N-acetyltransferase